MSISRSVANLLVGLLIGFLAGVTIGFLTKRKIVLDTLSMQQMSSWIEQHKGRA